MKTVTKLVGGLIVAALIAMSGLWIVKEFFDFDVFGSSSTTNDSRLVTAITRVEEIALLTLAIEGLSDNTVSSEIMGFTVPGSDRTTYIRYRFHAKLGLDGSRVQIEKVESQEGGRGIHVTIPEFIFIGHDEIEFERAAESRGILGWASPATDHLEIVNTTLGSSEEARYLADYHPLLVDQAEDFYRSIIFGVDPDVQVTFEFPEPPALVK